MVAALLGWLEVRSMGVGDVLPARLGDIVAFSRAMKSLIQTARRVVDADTSLLLLGETGAGKEMLARAIHLESPRTRGPFLAVNCGAIPEALLESELFGHETGAFTGAVRSHRGHVELAHRGTIFLDEIAEMPPHLQVKLLRVLQEKRFTRIGGEREIAADVRIMAATNRDLEQEIRARRFRPDLYYRIGVVTLTVPPLRERRDDIPELARRFLEQNRTQPVGRPLTLSDETLGILQSYSWPGNVRELANVLERAALLCTRDRISPADLPESMTRTGGRVAQNEIESDDSRDGWPSEIAAAEVGPGPPALVRPDELAALPLREARRRWLDGFERWYLAALLVRTGGRVGETARLAGITPRALYGKLRRLGLRKEDYR